MPMLNLFLWTNTPSVTAYDKHVEMCTGGRAETLSTRPLQGLGSCCWGFWHLEHTFAGELVAGVSL